MTGSRCRRPYCARRCSCTWSRWISSGRSGKFWWPGMAACSVSAQAKVPPQSPQGLLQPLPIPHRPWSHIALEFITGLPPSHHHTTILTPLSFRNRTTSYHLCNSFARDSQGHSVKRTWRATCTNLVRAAARMILGGIHYAINPNQCPWTWN